MNKTKRGYIIKEDVIIINRDLTELDLFVKKFINILNKYLECLIVSGFVSISAGRARGTEDIDILVPIMAKEKFKELFNDLVRNNFWCYQGDNPNIIYRYVKQFTSIRFAKKGEVFPNIEFIPIDKTRKAKWFEFNHPQKIRVRDFEFKIPPIEFEILYKEMILGSKKDIADAQHLRTFFSDIIEKKRLKEYKPIIKSESK